MPRKRVEKSPPPDVVSRSLGDCAAAGDLTYWSEQTGISTRVLREWIYAGQLEASQAHAGTKGSKLIVTKAAMGDRLREMSREARP